MEKYFELEDELKALRLQGVYVEDTLEALQLIINNLVIE